MRQQGLICVGVAFGWFLVTAAGHADEATAVATVKQNGGLIGMRKKEIKGLRELNLSVTRITDAGLRELKDLNELRSLFIDKTRVTDVGMKELKGPSPTWRP